MLDHDTSVEHLACIGLLGPDSTSPAKMQNMTMKPHETIIRFKTAITHTQPNIQAFVDLPADPSKGGKIAATKAESEQGTKGFRSQSYVQPVPSICGYSLDIPFVVLEKTREYLITLLLCCNQNTHPYTCICFTPLNKNKYAHAAMKSIPF